MLKLFTAHSFLSPSRLLGGRPSPTVGASRPATMALMALSVIAIAPAPGHAADTASAPAKGAVEADSPSALSAQAKKVLGKLVNRIRYSHDDQAAELLAFEPLAKRLLGDAWSKLSASEQGEVVTGLEKIVRRVSFARGREVFKYLNAVRFEPATQEGSWVKVRSTVVIFRDLKKTEMVIDWLLVDSKGGLKVVDTVMLGESTADAIRDEQVGPLLADGGVPALMAALRKKVAEVGG